MKTRESRIEAYLTKKISEIGGVCRKWVCPGRKGVPDRICILPYGTIYFIECKALKGKLSPLQKLEIEVLKSLDCNVLVLSSYNEVDNFLASISDIINPHK